MTRRLAVTNPEAECERSSRLTATGPASRRYPPRRRDRRPDALRGPDLLHLSSLPRLQAAHRTHVRALELERAALGGAQTGLAAGSSRGAIPSRTRCCPRKRLVTLGVRGAIGR